MKYLFLMVLVFSSILGGCASLITGSGPQAVSISTEPTNADISIVNNNTREVVTKVKSPFTATLERNDGFSRVSYNVIMALPGYQQEEVPINSSIAGWYWGNVFWGFGGLVGIMIDSGSGAAYTLDNDPIKVKLYPDTVEGRISKAKERFSGVDQLNKKDYDAAIAATTTAINLYPKYAEAFCNRGVAFAAINEDSKAINDLNTSISIKPEYPNAYCERGNVFFKQDKTEAAMEDYNKALMINPDYAEAIFGRGLVYQKQNTIEKAKADLKLACSKGFSRACNFQL